MAGTPLIESGDCTNSGNNTASTSWAIDRPAQAAGDLIICHLVSDANVTHGTLPAGPNGETAVVIAQHIGDTGTATVRVSVWYWVATASASAGTVTVTPSATEQWTATVARVPAGEFSPSSPIQHSNYNEAATTGAPDCPSFTATAANGRPVFFAGIDADTCTGINATSPSWTLAANVDRGAVTGVLAVRDTLSTASEAISSGALTGVDDGRVAVGYLINPDINTNYAPAPGSIVVSGFAPTANNGERSVRVTWARLVVPDAGITNTNVAPAAGTIVASGQAPTIRRDHICTPGAGSIAAQGFAPVAQRADSVFPAAGSIAAAGQAPTASVTDVRNISVAAGAIVATGYAPNADRTDNQTCAPPVGSIVAQGFAPSLTAEAHQFAYPANASLAVTGLAPTANATAHVLAYPGAGSIAAVGQTPTTGGDVIAEPAAGSVVATGYAPSATNSGDRALRVSWARLVVPAAEGSRTLYPAAGSIAAVGQAPSTTVPGNTNVSPGAGSIAGTGYAPTAGWYSVLIEWSDITGEDGYRIKWGTASDTYSWSADVAADATSYTIRGLVGTQLYFVRIYGLVSGVEQDPSAEIVLTPLYGFVPDPATIVAQGFAPTVSVSGNVSASPAAGSIAAVGIAPTVSASAYQTVAPGAASVVVGGFAPTADVSSPSNTNRLPAAGSVAAVGQAPTVQVSDVRSASPGAGSIAATGYAPGVEVTIRADVPAGSVAVAGFAPTLEQTTAATLAPGAGSIATQGLAPTVQVSGGGYEDDYGWIPSGGWEHRKPKKPKTESEREAEERQEAPDAPAVITQTAHTLHLPPDVPVVTYPTLDMTPLVIRERKALQKLRAAQLRAALEADDEDVLLLL